jgi:YHS domain-containing protein
MKWTILALPLILAACERHDPATHKSDAGSTDAAPAPAAHAADKVKDPVCGMMIERGQRKSEFEGTDYFFCADACRAEFRAEPAKYATACACTAPDRECDCTHCLGKRDPCECAQ